MSLVVVTTSKSLSRELTYETCLLQSGKCNAVVFDLSYLVPFRNQVGKNASWVEELGRISHLLTLVKLLDEWGEMSITIRSNLRCKFDARPP